MKSVFSAAIMSLGLVTSALAASPNGLSTPTPLAPSAPIIRPDLYLPSPCNLGARLALVSDSGTLAGPDLANAQARYGMQFANFKCADNVRPRARSDAPPATPTQGR